MLLLVQYFQHPTNSNHIQTLCRGLLLYSPLQVHVHVQYTYLPIPTYLHVFQSDCFPTCLLNCLSSYICVIQPTCFLPYLPTYSAVYLFTCLPRQVGWLVWTASPHLESPPAPPLLCLPIVTHSQSQLSSVTAPRSHRAHKHTHLAGAPLSLTSSSSRFLRPQHTLPYSLLPCIVPPPPHSDIPRHTHTDTEPDSLGCLRVEVFVHRVLRRTIFFGKF